MFLACLPLLMATDRCKKDDPIFPTCNVAELQADCERACGDYATCIVVPETCTYMCSTGPVTPF